jgi:hypothetical protein
MKKVRIWFIVLMCLIETNISYAQIASLSEGNRVRVWAPVIINNKIIGNLIGFSKDTLKISYSDSILQIPVSTLISLEKSNIRSKMGRGAALGLLTGTILSGGLAWAAVSSASVDNYNFINPKAVGVAALIGGLCGTLIGAVIGSTKKVDRWIPVRVNNSYTHFIHDGPATQFLPGLKLRYTF